jgi:scyllo-inositol 2-dehydrogenase (NADP+)
VIRTALIGLGKMGISHLAIFKAHPEIEVVAVCDPAKYLLDQINKFTGVSTYSDIRDLFAKEELDAVVVATPSRLHSDMVRQALERSLHVFCEKPFVLDPVEGEELVRMAEEKGLVNAVGYHYRHVGPFMEARRLIEANAIGRIHNIRAEAYGPVILRPKGATWRSKKAEGGGCLHDYASHAIDLMNYFVGPPEEVRGTVLNRVFSADVEDEVYSTLFYGDGATGQLLANWSDESNRKMSMKVSIWGEGGKIQADRQELQIYARDRGAAKTSGLNEGWNVRYTTDLTEEVGYYLRGEEYSDQVDAFAGAITGRRQVKSTFRTALDTARTVAKLIADANDPGHRVATARPQPARRGLMKMLTPRSA